MTSSSLPTGKDVDGVYEVALDRNEKDTIIIKAEAALKDTINWVAKNNPEYGNTITSVITKFVVDGLENELKITFDKKPSAINLKKSVRSGEAVPYYIKSQYEEALKNSQMVNYTNELQAGVITQDEVMKRIAAANNTIANIIGQGYNPEEFTSNKSTFGTKWKRGSWIWEVSKKTDEDETVMYEGREVTRKKKDETDNHYLQYADNGITVAIANLFETALYKEYDERDEFDNRTLRGVELQNQVYKEDGNELLYLIDETCPEGKIKEVKDTVSKDTNKVIGVHLVKLERKGERRYRYVCIDIEKTTDGTYHQIVFMNDRGSNRIKTAKEFFEIFTKVEAKTRKKKNA